MFLPLMSHLRVARPVGRPRTRPDAVRADRACSSRAIRSHLRTRGITAVIPEPADQQGHRKRRGSRGGRPVSYDPGSYRGRNVVERVFCDLKQWRGLATRYDKHAITHRAAVVLHAVITWTRRLSDTPYPAIQATNCTRPATLARKPSAPRNKVIVTFRGGEMRAREKLVGVSSRNRARSGTARTSPVWLIRLPSSVLPSRSSCAVTHRSVWEMTGRVVEKLAWKKDIS